MVFTTAGEGIILPLHGGEHLMAIALQTGRAKNHARWVMFVEAGIADEECLRQILVRHSPLERWAIFEQRFLQP